MSAPRVGWKEDGDSEVLMWGHIKVGEVTLGGNGTWYAYYLAADHKMKSLKDFIAPDLAKRAIVKALEQAA